MFVVSFLVCAFISVALTGKDLGYFFKYFFEGLFGTEGNVWNLFHETAILLLVALAVTPCFKMKFWNIGGEGQVLMGCLGAAVAIKFMGGRVNDAATIIVSLVLAISFGIVWAVIPALFKAKWNTNETLLTLMMNYIAVCLVNYFIKSVSKAGTGILTFSNGIMPDVGNEFVLKIVVVAILTTILAIYMKYSRHGYELTVVGESPNTAKYVGINSKVVIVRTLVLCGVLCGIAGFLLISATNHALNDTSVGGRGFVGVLISWLGQFNPVFMSIMSFLVVFIERGSKALANGGVSLGEDYPSIMTGIFFFFIIAVEFFVNYKFVFRPDVQVKIDAMTEKIKKAFAKKKTNEETPEEFDALAESGEDEDLGTSDSIEELVLDESQPEAEEPAAHDESKKEGK